MEAASAGGPTVCAIDVLSAQDLSRAGELIWTGRQRARFVVGSQGIEYALVSHWREQGHLLTNDRVPSLGPVDRIVVVSGSVSPTTHDQIVDAQDHGFDLIPFAATAVTSSQSVIDLEIEAATARALACLESGRSPIVATARGPEDPAVAAFRDAVASSALSPEQANHAVGDALGRVLDATLQRSRVCRGVVAGGDTSGHVMQRMDAFALTAVAQTTPGAALFRLHCDGPRDGIELALKGGQMGARDMFRQIRAGSKAADS